MEFIKVIVKYLPYFLPAAWLTLEISIMGILIGMLLGLFTAMLRISKKWWVNIFARTYIYVIRGTPLLVQFFFLLRFAPFAGSGIINGSVPGFGNTQWSIYSRNIQGLNSIDRSRANGSSPFSGYDLSAGHVKNYSAAGF